MTDTENDQPEEAPATWENVVVGKAKEALGRVTGDDELEEEGEDQVEIAYEVREDYEDNQP
jgi:uncharacterized protein YjbJ (UPF0337 family)